MKHFARRRPYARETGFSLAELVVAIAVAGALMAAMACVLGAGVRATARAERRQAAILIAQNQIEALRRAPRRGLAPGVRPFQPSDSPGRRLPSATGTVTVSNFTAGDLRLKKVAVEVSWRQGTGDRCVRLSTLIRGDT